MFAQRAGSNSDLSGFPTSPPNVSSNFGSSSNTGNAPGAPLPPQPLSIAQIRGLVEPLVGAMKTTSFYDIMGNSTLVVVLDVNSTVSVCVAAAQESKASSFLIWQPSEGGPASGGAAAAAAAASASSSSSIGGGKRLPPPAPLYGGASSSSSMGAGKFIAILTLTNFIQILIHSHEHPDEVAQLANMSLKQLLSMPFAKVRQTSLDGIVHAAPDIPLYNLLGLMISNGVNHIPILADSTVMGATGTSGAAPLTPNPRNSALPPPTHLVGVAFLPQLLSQLVRIINNSPSSSTAGGGMSPTERSSAAAAAAAAAAGTSASGSSYSQFATLFEVPIAMLPAMGPKLNCKVADGAVSWLRAEETVHQALKRLVDYSVQALPIIDERGRIVDTFSRSDVIGLEDLGVYNLNESVQHALYRAKHRSIVVCQMDDTVGDVVAHFVATGVRTIFVVQNEEFVGQLQVVDLLRFLFSTTT